MSDPKKYMTNVETGEKIEILSCKETTWAEWMALKTKIVMQNLDLELSDPKTREEKVL